MARLVRAQRSLPIYGIPSGIPLIPGIIAIRTHTLLRVYVPGMFISGVVYLDQQASCAPRSSMLLVLFFFKWLSAERTLSGCLLSIIIACYRVSNMMATSIICNTLVSFFYIIGIYIYIYYIYILYPSILYVTAVNFGDLLFRTALCTESCIRLKLQVFYSQDESVERQSRFGDKTLKS